MTTAKTVAFSRQATNIFFHILTGCNLSCRHCYINPGQHGRQTLPRETIERWLKAFADKADRANLILLGGEPTLHPDLADVVKFARRMGFKSITIDTNGYLFHQILERVSPKEVDFFSFSLDGATPETNDKIRGEGCYQACLDGIRRAVKSGFGTSLIYTVSRANLHELEAMVPLARDLGVRRFFIQVLGLRGKPARETDDAAGGDISPVSRTEWLARIPAVARLLAEEGISVTYPKVFLAPDEAFECAGNVADNYFIFPNGRIYRCPLCEDYPVHSLMFQNNTILAAPKLNEADLFTLDIAEGCVMNKLIQPQTLNYDADGKPLYQVACCLLKEEIQPENQSPPRGAKSKKQGRK